MDSIRELLDMRWTVLSMPLMALPALYSDHSKEALVTTKAVVDYLASAKVGQRGP